MSFPAVPTEMCGKGAPNPTTGTVYVGLAPTSSRYQSGLELFTIGQVSDPELTDYVTTYSGDCGTGGEVSLAPGEHKTCVVTNTYVGHEVIGDPNGTALLTVEKVMENVPLPAHGQPLFSACDADLELRGPGHFSVRFRGAPEDLCSQEPQPTGTTLVSLTPSFDPRWGGGGQLTS